MSLNITQYIVTRSDRRSDIYSADAFFGIANDHSLVWLYRQRDDGISSAKQPIFEHAASADLDREVRDYAHKLRTSKELLRDKPTASFLVLHNDGKRTLNRVEVFSWNPTLRKESLMFTVPPLSPDQWVLFPLSFRQPGSDGSEPELPEKLILRYEGETKEITSKQKRVTWLRDDFVRALVSQR